MVKKARNKEAEKAVLDLIRSTPLQIAAVVGGGIYLLPRAAAYLTDHIEQGTAYLLGAAWKGVTGKVDEAENAIDASGRYYRRQVDEFLGKESAEDKQEVLDEILTLKPRDQISLEDYKTQMNIPLSAHFINVTAIRAAAYLMSSGLWSYYGVRIINEDRYLFLLPVTISLYTVKVEEQTQPVDDRGFCPAGWKRVDNLFCTRTVEVQTTIPPTISGTEAKGKSSWTIMAKMGEAL